MPNGHVRQNALLEMHGRVAHATGQAGWTPASLFATERDQLAMATLAAFELEETTLEATAPQIGIELVSHEAR
jgi:hypothetical protein